MVEFFALYIVIPVLLFIIVKQKRENRKLIEWVDKLAAALFKLQKEKRLHGVMQQFFPRPTSSGNSKYDEAVKLQRRRRFTVVLPLDDPTKKSGD